MADDPSELIPPVDAEEAALRYALRKNHIDANGKLTAAAFVLREQDQGKLSLFRPARGKASEHAATFSRIYGVGALNCGEVRALKAQELVNLEIEPDEPPVGHAALLNLPDPLLESARAEFIAGELRDRCKTPEL